MSDKPSENASAAFVRERLPDWRQFVRVKCKLCGREYRLIDASVHLHRAHGIEGIKLPTTWGEVFE